MLLPALAGCGGDIDSTAPYDPARPRELPTSPPYATWEAWATEHAGTHVAATAAAVATWEAEKP